MTHSTVIIGFGFIGKAHYDCLTRLGIPVTGIVDQPTEQLEAFVAARGLRLYSDWQEAISDPDVQVIHNCTPNALHQVINSAAIEAGKHIFSEKPLGIDAQETAQQWRLAQRSAVKHAVNFTYRGYPLVHELRALVQQGTLGDIRFIKGHYLQDWLLFPTDYSWRLHANREETRAVADIGSHLVDLARFVTDLNPRSVYAAFETIYEERYYPAGEVKAFEISEASTETYPVFTEDHATLLIDFGTAKANFEVSQVAAGHKNDLFIEVLGTRGSASWHQERPEELHLGFRDQPNQTIVKSNLLSPAGQSFMHYPAGHPEGYPDAMSNVIRTFHASLGGGASPFATFEDGHIAAQVIEAAVQSQESKAAVKLGQPAATP